jgi:hypothetical protein
MSSPYLQSRSCTALALAVLVLGTAACGDNTGPSEAPEGLANCGGTPMLTVSPVDISIIRDLAPLGNLNPPVHTLPTDHLYFFANVDLTEAELVPVVSPGDIAVSEVTRQTRLSGAASVIDYSMTFFPCADLSLYFAHVVLTPELLAEIGPFGTCNQYVAGGDTYESCAKRVNLKLKAGALIGAMGGTFGNVLDFGGYDRRVAQLPFVNQARSYGNGTEFGQNRTICPVDYFVVSVASWLRGKFGTSSKRRTVDPLCGTIMQDVPNTAQGRWFFNDTPQDEPHLALAHDNIDPRIGVISVGTSVPSLPPRYWGFTPAATGRVNADFPRVTVDGLTYCYENFLNATQPIKHVLVQLISATRVRIEGFAGALCGNESTWAFTAGAREFAR